MDYKLLSKNIAEYLLRVICFMLTVKFWFIEVSIIGLLISTPIYILESLFETYRLKTQNIKYDEFGTVTIFDICLIAFITLYFLAKIFGIFKKLDKLNIFISLVIVSCISNLLILVGRINFLVDEMTYRDGLKYAYTMYLLIPAFLLYKFFGFLTIKFPVPFKKIGYYTSIEFPKDLYSKIKKNYIKKP